MLHSGYDDLGIQLNILFPSKTVSETVLNYEGLDMLDLDISKNII